MILGEKFEWFLAKFLKVILGENFEKAVVNNNPKLRISILEISIQESVVYK